VAFTHGSIFLSQQQTVISTIRFPDDVESVADYGNCPSMVSRITFAIMRARVTKAAPRRQAATIMIREAMPATASPTPGIQPIRKSNPKRICVPRNAKDIVQYRGDMIEMFVCRSGRGAAGHRGHSRRLIQSMGLRDLLFHAREFSFGDESAFLTMSLSGQFYLVLLSSLQREISEVCHSTN
jgi:hypothetical protein